MFKWLFTGVLVLAGLFGLSQYVLNKEPLTEFRDDTTGLVLGYSSGIAQVTLAEVDREDKILFRGEVSEGESQGLVTVRWEDGLKIVASTARQSVAGVIADSIQRSFPSRFPDFKLISQRSFIYNTRDAIEAEFTYRGPSGETIRQKFFALVRDDDSAVYIATQAPSDEYSSLERAYFADIFDNIVLE